jgi:alkylation response protein AidB-like acyl-CoA dehydrogenase
VPAERARIHDTWRVSGLRGTGSHDYSLEGVFVPAAYAIDAFADEPTRPERLYAYPVIPLVTGAVGAVPIGIARGAIEELTRLAQTRKRSGRLLAEDATVQGGLAHAEILARAAERLLFEAVDEMWETVKRGKPATLEQRAHVRMGCVNAGVSAAAAVDTVWGLAGSRAIFEDAGLERRFRDVHVATQHVALAPRTLEMAGRVLLGLEPGGRF